VKEPISISAGEGFENEMRQMGFYAVSISFGFGQYLIVANRDRKK
jgi:hypothetical protein